MKQTFTVQKLWLGSCSHITRQKALIPKLTWEQDVLGALGSCGPVADVFLPCTTPGPFLRRLALEGLHKSDCLSNTKVLQLHPAQRVASQCSRMVPVTSLKSFEIKHRGAHSFLAVWKQNLMECISICSGRNFSTIF